MRKLLALTVLITIATSAGCGICDRIKRGSLFQPWNTSEVTCYDSCVTCTPEDPCGACESCISGATESTPMTSPPVLPSPGI